MNTSGSGAVVLSALLSPAAIQLNLRGTHRDEVLQELVNQLPELADRPEARQTLLAALRERELLHSTGIGGGIALPHARNALAGLVDHAVIVFGRHPKGIAYGAVDGMPARLFFMLIAPTVQQHLAILARISRLLRDVKLRDDLLTADKPEAVIALVRSTESRM
ncbi:MAG: PTS sugar transporter subunit IIA [Verrucomicrobia bacterium]|nr:PTS sugar transporter subunit IIA [Verrucomicrobiota bacterium]